MLFMLDEFAQTEAVAKAETWVGQAQLMGLLLATFFRGFFLWAQ
jgi:hypothetical protein